MLFDDNGSVIIIIINMKKNKKKKKLAEVIYLIQNKPSQLPLVAVRRTFMQVSVLELKFIYLS